MLPWTPWILLAALAAGVAQAAVVYKWTDDHGVVHYSDQSVPGAEKMFTTSTPNASSSSPPTGSARAGVAAARKPVSNAINYTQFSIISPTPEQAFFGDDVVNVHLALVPALKEGQTITWHLNGKELEEQGTSTTQFTLPSLERGAYVIAAASLRAARP